MFSFQFDPYAPAIDADPFPYYRRLRDEHPCFWSEQAQMWVLSRYVDIVSALNDWQTYSSASRLRFMKACCTKARRRSCRGGSELPRVAPARPGSSVIRLPLALEYVCQSLSALTMST